MGKIIVTGAGGLIGSQTCEFFLERGFDVIGIDNNMRKYFFGESGDTSKVVSKLASENRCFENKAIDIRGRGAILAFFELNKDNIEAVVHTAAQPSHDWAAREPFTDFDVNTNGTLNLLEACRLNCPEAAFMFTSTNKVYGDRPNNANLEETETRYEFSQIQHMPGVSAQHGISEELSIDNSIHSIFGASKVSADILCQEYGKYFGMKTGIFRGGCLTGPQHSSVELHGFLSYIIKCAKSKKQYTIFGYKGKQVRDQIHSEDVVNLFWEFMQKPRNGEVYNLGGGKANSASILETIDMLEEFDLKLDYKYAEKNRVGDHICYYTDLRKAEEHYPKWSIRHPLKKIIGEIVDR